jgi:hypothetical protein
MLGTISLMSLLTTAVQSKNKHYWITTIKSAASLRK